MCSRATCTGLTGRRGLKGGQGIVTKVVGTQEVVFQYHRMENCGRKLLGQYCHHLHHRHEHGGTFIGVALQHSVSKGFTIHGTSNALVQASTILNHRGPGIYLENGASSTTT